MDRYSFLVLELITEEDRGCRKDFRVGKRTLVISDIHGMTFLLKKALKDNNYDPMTDQLILLGDYIDRGEDSYGAVRLVKALQNKGAVVLRGNHEQMAIDAFKNKSDMPLWDYNGATQTRLSYDLNVGDLEQDVEWFDTLDLFYETEDYFFVHAGINPFKNINSQLERDLLWIREAFYKNINPYEKTVVFGHTPFGWPTLFSNNTLGIDSASFHRGRLTTLEITEQGERNFYMTTMLNTDKVTVRFVDLMEKGEDYFV